jgi:hypothetical protein
LEADPSSQDSALISFEIGRDKTTGSRTGETDRSGVYVVKLKSLDGLSKQQRFVLNVPTSDSNLAILESQELAEQLDELDVEIHSADELEYESTKQDGVSWSQLLAGLLIVLLLGEQFFAYSASYHPKGGNER